MDARRIRTSPTALLIAVAMAVVGYAAGLAANRAATPAPSPSGVGVIPSPTPHGSTSASRPPSGAPATLQPTEPPHWAWRPTEFPLDEQLSVDRVWGLEDQVLGIASVYGDAWYVPMYRGGDGWSMSPGPRAISRYWGGIVVDDRLWFLAHEEGLRPRESSLRIVGTDGGDNPTWEVLGRSDLDVDYVPRFLGKIRGTWVVAYLGEGGNIEIGAPQYLETSTDGIHWSPARVAGLRGVDPFDVGFTEGGATREFIVVPTSIARSGTTEIVFLVSRDGLRWREVRPPEQLGWWFDFACNDRACVVTPYSFEDTPLRHPSPVAWISTDGVTWTASTTTLADESVGTGIRYVGATNDGFVGIEGERSTVAWMSSPDGMTWRRYEVLPTDLKVPVVDFAIGGDFAVALEQGPDIERQRAWVGSIAAMRNAN